jgi:hypothetical protein
VADQPSHIYRAHGLVVASDIELALPPGPRGPNAPDMVLRMGGEHVVPDEHPAGTQIATTKRRDGTTLYHFARDHEHVVLRYPRLCEFIGDPTLSDIMIYMHPGVDRGIAPVLVGGAVIAVHLRLRNELVLHASAVRAGDRAVAFVGASGMGKSTLAAALCRNGYDLVTDDVLRVDLTGGTTPRALPGSTENRLRPSARQLADDAPAHAVRPTADGRLALRSPAWSTAPLPLSACVVPFPSRGAQDLAVHRLPRAGALLRLLRFPRIVGWTDPVTAAAEFQALADLVERVPVFDVAIPWGLPFRPGLLASLVETVTIEAADHVTCP